MHEPQKKGWFLLKRAIGARGNWPAPPEPGNYGGVVPCKGEGREVMVGNGMPHPEELSFRGDGEDRDGEQMEAEVWRRIREAGFFDEAVLQRRDRRALLEKALNEMHAEVAEGKLESQKKLFEVHAFEATVEEKYLEAKGKLHSLNARLAEVNRKSSEVDRRLEDVEARECKVHKESSFFIIEYAFYVTAQELQDSQKKLARWHNFLNEREMEAHERCNTLKKKEKELEESWKTLEIFNDSIKLKEEDMFVRLRDLHAKEKVRILYSF
ncbi:hypothetical protein BHM03_00035945 [Ensete ventricosum]|nr:hypothetical protein BHM03_00035945 [Ensete ventricosum]